MKNQEKKNQSSKNGGNVAKNTGNSVGKNTVARDFGEKKSNPMDNPYLVELGQNIQKQREFLGKSQEELGLDLGTTKVTISRYESAQMVMKVDRFFEIADALYVTPADLCPKELNNQQDVDLRLFQIGEMMKKLKPQQQADAYRAMEAMLLGMQMMSQ